MNELVIFEKQDLLDNIKDKSKKLRHGVTPKRVIKTRQGKANQSFKYVSWVAVCDWLDTNYPGWSFEASNAQVIGQSVSVLGTLIVVDNGLIRKFSCYGEKEGISSEGKFIAIPYIKAAETDALKRCVARLGGFNDVYTDVEVETESEINNESIEFITTILPRAIEEYKDDPSKIFNQIKGFMSGKISLSRFKERYKL